MESIWNLIPMRRGIGSRLTRGALVREINEGRDLGNSKHRRQKVLETEREEVNARRTRRGEFRIVERFVLHEQVSGSFVELASSDSRYSCFYTLEKCVNSPILLEKDARIRRIDSRECSKNRGKEREESFPLRRTFIRGG